MHSLFRLQQAPVASRWEDEMEWEETDCPLCAARNYRPLLEAPDAIPCGTGLVFAVVQCQDCGLCFTNPRPTRQYISRFYPDEYEPHRLPSARQLSMASGSQARHTGRQLRKYPFDIVGNGGRLLDFGCGGGYFLLHMQRKGWDVTGVDISLTTVHNLRNKYGLEAFAGTLPHPALRPGSYNAITMWHSLEHVHSPRQVVQAAYQLLVPGGKLIVAVPNIESLPFAWFGPSWYGLDLPRHLVHFTPGTLKRLLENAGFQVEPIRWVRHSSWLRRSASIARNYQGSSWRMRLLANGILSRAFSLYCTLVRQTDCIMAVAVKN